VMHTPVLYLTILLLFCLLAILACVAPRAALKALVPKPLVPNRGWRMGGVFGGCLGPQADRGCVAVVEPPAPLAELRILVLVRPGLRPLFLRRMGIWKWGGRDDVVVLPCARVLSIGIVSRGRSGEQCEGGGDGALACHLPLPLCLQYTIREQINRFELTPPAVMTTWSSLDTPNADGGAGAQGHANVIQASSSRRALSPYTTTYRVKVRATAVHAFSVRTDMGIVHTQNCAQVVSRSCGRSILGGVGDELWSRPVCAVEGQNDDIGH